MAPGPLRERVRDSFTGLSGLFLVMRQGNAAFLEKGAPISFLSMRRFEEIPERSVPAPGVAQQRGTFVAFHLANDIHDITHLRLPRGFGRHMRRDRNPFMAP